MRGALLYGTGDIRFEEVADPKASKPIADEISRRQLEAMAQNAEDFGVTWTPRDIARFWTGVTSSADGSRETLPGTSGPFSSKASVSSSVL